MAKGRPAARVAEMDGAMRRGTPLRIERESKLAPLVGWVVSIGIRWCIVVEPSGVRLGSYVAIRVRDLRSVRPVPPAEIGPLTVGSRPAAPVGVDPTSTGTLLVTAGDAFGLVTLTRERHRADRGCTGRVLWVADKRVTLGRVDPATLSPKRARTIRFGDISRVSFGGPIAREAPVSPYRA